MNKNLISQIVVSLCALLLIATVTFAWFTINNEANGSLIAQIGDMETNFEFAAVENDKLVDSSGVSTLDMKDVIPGQKFFFLINIETKGSSDGKVSIMLNDIKSYFATPTNDDSKYQLNEEYTYPCEKIQYAFSYSITGAYWVPMGVNLSNKEFDQTDPLGIVESSWIEFSTQEKNDFYPTYDGTIESEQHVRFNKEDSENTNIDKDDYVLMKNVLVKGANSTDEDKTASDHNAFVVIFEIDFLDIAILPDFVEPYYDFDSKNSNIYETQLFSISNITIITTEEE